MVIAHINNSLDWPTKTQLVDLTLKMQDNLSNTTENLTKEVRLHLVEAELAVACEQAM